MNKLKKTRKRPLPILIFAVFHVVGGISILSMLFNSGIITGFLFFSLFFLGLLTLFSGIGMWLGKVWGWWVGAFYYLYAVARSLNVLFLLKIGDQGIEMTGKYYIKYGGKMLISLLILAYFFHPKVRKYFFVEGKSKKRLIGFLLMPLFILFLISTVANLIIID